MNFSIKFSFCLILLILLNFQILILSLLFLRFLSVSLVGPILTLLQEGHVDLG